MILVTNLSATVSVSATASTQWQNAVSCDIAFDDTCGANKITVSCTARCNGIVHAFVAEIPINVRAFC